MQLSKYFNLSEFTSENVTDSNILSNLKKLSVELDKVREVNGRPMVISPGGGWRSTAFQKVLYARLKGTQAVAKPGNSRHEKGLAADFAWRYISPKTLAWLRKNWKGGLGVYNWGVHLDLGTRRRW